MGIGTLRCHVIDVTDLEQAEGFWSEVTGLEVIGSNFMGRFSYIGHPDPWHHEIILQKVDTPKGDGANRAHVDITPNQGIDDAVARIEALGGAVKKPPSVYPRPGTHPTMPPRIDWAVMQDPFGNEFCLVFDLTDEQSEAAAAAAAIDGVADDHGWRVAAGQTPQ